MSSEEFESLKSDIEQNGQMHEIVLWRGLVVDGRNRLRACLELGVEPETVSLDSSMDPVVFAISNNLHRRHLSTTQRAMVAAKLANLSKHKKKDDTSNDVSQDDAASVLNVSVPSVQRAKQVIENGSSELVEAVERGEVPVSLAAKLVAQQPDKSKQSEIVERGACAVRDYLEDDEPSPVPTKSEEQTTNNLSEFKRFWKKCSPEGRTAIRIWIDENYLNN
jgi:ParB-like chromosome segregation protein Spo0J